MAFKEQDDLNKDKQNEDSFGLPDLDYKPLDKLDETTSSNVDSSQSAEHTDSTSSEQRIEEEAVKEEYRSPYTPMAEEPKSKAPIVIGIIIVLILALAAYLINQYVIKPNAEKERIEQLAKQEKERKAKEEAARLAQEEEERKKREAEEAAAKAKPAEGAIESLTAPTSRYYVVVASAVDADLVMDYAKKLSAKGVGSKIIPPFGKYKFNRIAISDFDTYAAAQTAADASKTEYGNEVWVIRY
jgi:hypothetical protein